MCRNLVPKLLVLSDLFIFYFYFIYFLSFFFSFFFLFIISCIYFFFFLASLPRPISVVGVMQDANVT